MSFLEKCEPYLAPTGRIIMGAFFVLAAVNKMFNFEGTALAIESVGFPMGSVFAVLTIILLLGAGGALLAGFKPKLAALALAAFTILVTFLFHGPHLWAADPSEQMSFMKNLVIFGSLLFMAAHVGAFLHHGEKSTVDKAPTPTL